MSSTPPAHFGTWRRRAWECGVLLRRQGKGKRLQPGCSTHKQSDSPVPVRLRGRVAWEGERQREGTLAPAGRAGAPGRGPPVPRPQRPILGTASRGAHRLPPPLGTAAPPRPPMGPPVLSSWPNSGAASRRPSRAAGFSNWGAAAMVGGDPTALTSLPRRRHGSELSLALPARERDRGWGVALRDVAGSRPPLGAAAGSQPPAQPSQPRPPRRQSLRTPPFMRHQSAPLSPAPTGYLQVSRLCCQPESRPANRSGDA